MTNVLELRRTYSDWNVARRRANKISIRLAGGNVVTP